MTDSLSDKDKVKFTEDEKGENRMFTRVQKQVCWNLSKPIMGRDPIRWRYDPAGNPVLHQLRGCHGALCHEYDHIVPYAKGGKTIV